MASDLQANVNSQPEVLEAQEDFATQRRKQKDVYQGYKDERDAINGEFQGNIDQAAGQLKPWEFRARVAELRGERAIRQDQLRDDRSDTLSFLEEFDPRENAFDQALDGYAAALFGDDLEDPVTGAFDFEERDRRLDRLSAKYGSEMITRVVTHLRRNENATETELRAAQETLRPYWEIGQDWNFSNAPEWQPLYDQWLDATSVERQTMDEFAEFRKRRSAERKAMRGQRQGDTFAVDAALVKWYEYKPVSVDGQRQWDIYHPPESRQVGITEAPAAATEEPDGFLSQLEELATR